MNFRAGESGVPSTRINITVSPTPLWQPPDDGDEISDGLSAGLAADSNDLTGLSDSFSRADLNQQVIDDEVQSHPNTPDSDGGRTPGSSSISATSTTLRDGYIPPAPTPPQPRQRATTVQSRAEGAHVSSPTGYINNIRLGAFVHEREAPPGAPPARRASPVVQNHESEVPPPPRPDHLLSTLQTSSLYLTPPHLHPKLHHLLDPTILAERLHTQTFEPAIFSIRLADVLFQVCAPRRDGMIVELVGKMCIGSGAENGGSSGGEVVTRR